MLKRKPDAPRGILHIRRDEAFVGLERFEASEKLRPFVEHYWAVTWMRQPPGTRETMPHPSVHLVLETDRCELHGIYQNRFTRIIEGSGRALGTKFRPGGFRPFLKTSVARLTGKIVHPSTVFGTSISELEAETSECQEAAAAFERIDRFLTQFDPIPTEELMVVSDIAQSIACDGSITRVETLVTRFDIGLRTLQRMFREYVGVSPKWVIQRHRLIEAAERIRNGDDSTDFAALSVDLGYSDQSHFIRDFKTMVGKTPADYLKSLR